MSTNIVILTGSPRKGGTSDKLAAAFKEGAEASGKKVTLFRAADMKINPCLGCNCCKRPGGSCVHADDMDWIISAMKKADAIVFASPIYWFTVSAQLKLAIDRTHAESTENLAIKRAVLLTTCADEASVEAEKGAIIMYQKMLAYRKWEDAGIITVAGLSDVDDISIIDGRQELDQARELGKNI